jgi:hypothetical protein
VCVASEGLPPPVTTAPLSSVGDVWVSSIGSGLSGVSVCRGAAAAPAVERGVSSQGRGRVDVCGVCGGRGCVCVCGDVAAVPVVPAEWVDPLLALVGRLGPTISLPKGVFAELNPEWTFPEVVIHATKFVSQAKDRTACTKYAEPLLAGGQGPDAVIVAAHLQLMKRVGIVAACAEVQRQHKHNYLQPDVVRREFQDFPEYDTLLSLAEEGAHIFTPAEWSPNRGVGVSVRPNAVRMAAPILVRFGQEQLTGDVILVEKGEFDELARSEGLDFNVISVDWVFKPGDKESDLLGRIIDDFTNSEPALNSPETFVAMEAVYNPLVLPQLANMCESMCVAREAFPDEGRRLSCLSEGASAP